MILVTNVKDTGEKRCTCEGSKDWLNHWELKKNTTAVFCRACSKETSVKGGLVKIFRDTDRTTYVVPLCDKCAQKEEEFSIWSRNVLVSAECT